jgi:hypothetical protein
MGTRGALGFVVDETAKITYNHFDSYPDGLGDDTLAWLRTTLDEGREQEVRDQARALVAVDEDSEPTAEEWERFGHLADRNVSTGQDWYALLRDTQGDAGKILEAGAYADASTFPLDSLFCEWAYLVDFDTRTFEVYEGFRRTPATEGRWAEQSGRGDYYPIQRIAAYSFDELPERLALEERV